MQQRHTMTRYSREMIILKFSTRSFPEGQDAGTPSKLKGYFDLTSLLRSFRSFQASSEPAQW